MPFVVEKCTDADMQRMFEIFSVSFGHEHEYCEAVFPNHDTPAGRAAGSERMLAMAADPNATFIKVVNDEGKMIAGAKWNVYDGEIPPDYKLEGDYWKNQEEKDYANDLFAAYLAPRRKAIKDSDGNLVCMYHLDAFISSSQWTDYHYQHWT
jgi:hypothetical protein